ncbi:MAG: endolytic transglycosylase MltG [Chloroflexi bacterium]|nr:endolytic transglycosylase MltG [Chloroflexota bacterium]
MKRPDPSGLTRLAFAVLFLGLVGCALAALLVQRATVRQSLSVSIAERLDEPASADATPVRFVIARGESAGSIADRLRTRELIRDATLFRLLLRLRDAEATLEAGEYLLRPNMRPTEIIETLQHSSRQGTAVTIPEGWRVAEIADALEQKGIARRELFLSAVRSPGLLSTFPWLKGLDSAEGYLFPDTYRFLPDTPAEEVARRMLRNFDERFPERTRARSQVVGLSWNQVVILASVVEREAVHPDERARIAGVYLNRLQRGMRLQADPTVQYAIAGITPPAGQLYWRVLSPFDLSVQSPYNTYLNLGLPPGPICNPGRASIDAALVPERHDYLYFVARPDRTHAFARTLTEHNENVARYQSGSTPR